MMRRDPCSTMRVEALGDEQFLEFESREFRANEINLLSENVVWHLLERKGQEVKHIRLNSR